MFLCTNFFTEQDKVEDDSAKERLLEYMKEVGDLEYLLRDSTLSIDLNCTSVVIYSSSSSSYCTSVFIYSSSY